MERFQIKPFNFKTENFIIPKNESDEIIKKYIETHESNLNEIIKNTNLIFDKKCKEKDNNIKKYIDEKNK